MNRIGTTAILAAAFLGLTACDGAKEQPAPAPKATAPAKKVTVNQPVEDAMMRIPPEMRADYQKAYVCEIKREQAKSQAIKVTPAYVDDLVKRLKADPGIMKC